MNGGNAKPSGRPKHMSDYAEACLAAIAARGLGQRISLGGASGLMHYLDYRPTNDVDAWWVGSPAAEEQREVIRLVESTLASLGEVKTRIWGDVVSVELRRERRQVFSFQIARRSAQLEDARLASWIGVLVDSLADLVASKMVALVERGAPRDFRDIHALCQAGLTTAGKTWQLWRRRQQLAGSDTDAQRARLAVETHLARIAAHRPLDQIVDSRQRAEAQEARLGSRRCSSVPSSNVADNDWIDGALYPDTDVPAQVTTLGDRVDFLARLCAAWDFGILPHPETVAEIRRAEWRDPVDACRLITSPAYHLLRDWHGLPPLPYLGQQLAYIRDDPNLAYV